MILYIREREDEENVWQMAGSGTWDVGRGPELQDLLKLESDSSPPDRVSAVFQTLRAKHVELGNVSGLGVAAYYSI